MLLKRLLTAALLIAVIFIVLFNTSEGIFAVISLGLMLIAAWEWSGLMADLKKHWRCLYVLLMLILMLVAGGIPNAQVLYGVSVGWFAISLLWMKNYPNRTEFWSKSWVLGFMGSVMLPSAWLALANLRMSIQGPWLVLYLLMIVWSADTGAYFAGRLFGKHKLAARVSPNKTIEGLLGGLLLVLLLSLSTLWLMPQYTFFSVVWVGLSVFVGLSSVVGDLFESLLKRQRGVKDSGSLLPGHGGILDRIDSLLAAAPVFALGLHLLQGAS